jgi:hypothetical protein
MEMTNEQTTAPEQCPACAGELEITQLRCKECDTVVDGEFQRDRLVNLTEPYASVLEMFLRVRGNVKEMERKLGLSYPTVRARLEEAFDAAGMGRKPKSAHERRMEVLERLSRGEINAAEAAEQLKQAKERRS